MREWLKRNSHDIKVGIIVSLITAGIMSGVHWFVESAPQIGHSVSSTFINLIYVSAAQETDSSITRLMFECLVWMMILIALSMFKEGISLLRKSSELPKDVAMQPQNEQEDSQILNKQKGQKYSEANTNPDEMKRVNYLERSKKLGQKTIIASVLLAVLVTIISLNIIYPIDLWNRFERDITCISPYVEESTVQKLESDWVQMKSKADYMKIYQTINSVKNEFDLK